MNENPALDADGSVQHEVPAPTIVGPRPDHAKLGRMSIPRGLENLLSLAGQDDAWRTKTLADPVRAAGEAQIPLSASETAILRSIPSQTLGQMIASFARTSLTSLRRPALAMGTAAAALLAAESSAEDARTRAELSEFDEKFGRAVESTSGEDRTMSYGISPNTPPQRTAGQGTRTNIQWVASIEEALAQSASNRAVMVVYPDRRQAMGSAGARRNNFLSDEEEDACSRYLDTLCLDGSDAVVAAIKSVDLLAVVLRNEFQIYKRADPDGRRRSPLVLFLSPDGTMMSCIISRNETQLVRAINDVPQMLARWKAGQVGTHAVSRGVRPDVPASKGMRPDVPVDKQ
jgi:hypothetical protein